MSDHDEYSGSDDDGSEGEPEEQIAAPVKGVKERKRKTPAEPKKPRAKKEKPEKKTPRRAQTAWMFFSKDKRAEVKIESPNADFALIGQRLGEKWKAATAEEKAPYEEMARKDKAACDAEREASGEPSRKKARGGPTKVCLRKDASEPRKPMSAWMIFSAEQRPEVKKTESGAANHHLDFGAIGRKLGQMWGALTKADKEPYEAKAKIDKARYEKELEIFKANGGEVFKKPRKTKAKKNSGSDGEDGGEKKKAPAKRAQAKRPPTGKGDSGDDYESGDDEGGMQPMGGGGGHVAHVGGHVGAHLGHAVPGTMPTTLTSMPPMSMPMPAMPMSTPPVMPMGAVMAPGAGGLVGHASLPVGVEQYHHA